MTIALAVVGLIVIVALIFMLPRSGRRPDARPSSPSSSARTPPDRRQALPEAPISRAPAGGASPAAPAAVPAALSGFRLLTENDLAPDQKAVLLTALRAIAKPPRSMNTVLSPDFMDGERTNELVEFIMREPIVAAKVLATVNSPFYGLQSPIGSVGHAVTFLGLNTVRNVAVQMLAKESFKTDNPALQKVCDGIWNAGMIASELCFRLAQKLGMPDQGTLSTQTLLSFFGDFAILLVLPAQSSTHNWQAGLLARTEAEQRETGVNSSIVGSLLMQEWGLPPGIVEGVGEVASVLVTPPGAQSPQRAARLALRYASARIGESVAFGGLRDLDEFDFRTDTSPEYYFLSQYFALPDLARFHEHLRTPEMRGVVRKLVAKLPESGSEH